MYRVCVKDSFSSAHFLRNYKGKCEKVHGHNWKVSVNVASPGLKNGLVLDFTDLKKTLKKITKLLDHGFLNEMEYFRKNNPTSENIAKYIFDSLQKALPARVRLEEVRVAETENNIASYSAE